ncbi:MAG: hypothetical protein ACJ73E_13965 [Mycobacteriales bacterium]
MRVSECQPKVAKVGTFVPAQGGVPLARSTHPTSPADPGRVNLLNWDGKGRPSGLFPPRRPGAGRGAPELMDGNDPAAETEPKP